MTAKEFLQSIAHYKRRAASIKARIREARAAAENVTARYSGEGGGSAHNASSAIERAVISMVQEEKRLGDTLEKLYTARAEAERIIDMLPNELHKEVLEMRYLDGKSWLRIARELHYTKRWVYRLHDRALEEFSGIYEKSAL